MYFKEIPRSDGRPSPVKWLCPTYNYHSLPAALDSSRLLWFMHIDDNGYNFLLGMFYSFYKQVKKIVFFLTLLIV